MSVGSDEHAGDVLALDILGLHLEAEQIHEARNFVLNCSVGYHLDVQVILELFPGVEVVNMTERVLGSISLMTISLSFLASSSSLRIMALSAGDLNDKR